MNCLKKINWDAVREELIEILPTSVSHTKWLDDDTFCCRIKMSEKLKDLLGRELIEDTGVSKDESRVSEEVGIADFIIEYNSECQFVLYELWYSHDSIHLTDFLSEKMFDLCFVSMVNKIGGNAIFTKEQIIQLIVQLHKNAREEHELQQSSESNDFASGYCQGRVDSYKDVLERLNAREEIMMSIWSYIKSDFKYERKTYIDAWLTNSHNEEGKTIAKIDTDYNVEYIDERARTDSYAQEIIEDTRFDCLAEDIYPIYKDEWVSSRGYNIEDYDEEKGFPGGESFSCFGEFRDAEYREDECMRDLLEEEHPVLWKLWNEIVGGD